MFQVGRLTLQHPLEEGRVGLLVEQREQVVDGRGDVTGDRVRFTRLVGIELRKKIRAVRREFEEKETRPERRWFFEPFVPDRVSIADAARERGR